MSTERTQFDSDVAAIGRALTGYQERIADYERFVTKIHGLLMAGQDDEAMDIVRAEFDAIHGPND